MLLFLGNNGHIPHGLKRSLPGKTNKQIVFASASEAFRVSRDEKLESSQEVKPKHLVLVLLIGQFKLASDIF